MIDVLILSGHMTVPRGVEWAATGDVTLTGPDRRGDRRINPWPYYNGEG
ncbi:hypothetical protein [uncultured Microbacterium sp.]|nr:hypothetical protein [uncultured Microbacterium sp.]